MKAVKRAGWVAGGGFLLALALLQLWFLGGDFDALARMMR